MKAALVGRRTSQRPFASAISREAYTFISYQGQRPSSVAVGAVDFKALDGGGQFRCAAVRNFDGRETRSKVPTLAGLDAGARGIADHLSPDGDALLVWFRTAGRMRRREVELYLARRAIAAGWDCDASDAAAIIEDAMLHVLTRRKRCAAKQLRMRKCDFLALRSRSSAWLRAGILDASWRYGIAADLWEPPPP